jgi:hypothetical protein
MCVSSYAGFGARQRVSASGSPDKRAALAAGLIARKDYGFVPPKVASIREWTTPRSAEANHQSVALMTA